MPRLSPRLSPEETAIANEFRANYGGMMSISTVAKAIGNKDIRTAQKLMEGVKGYEINGRKHYMVSDVARRVYGLHG